MRSLVTKAENMAELKLRQHRINTKIRIIQ